MTAYPGLPIVPLGYEQLSGTGVLALTVPAGAKMAAVTVSGNPVRYRDDGTDPDATHGVTLPVTTAGLPFEYAGRLSAIRFIPTTGTATLDVLYYR